MDHPAFDTNEQQAVNHIGYGEVAADRSGVTKLWTDPKIKKIIKQLDIELINYKDLLDKK